MSPPSSSGGSRPFLKLLRRWAHWILLSLGLAAAVALVRSVGPAQVMASIVSAGRWLPLILLLDLSWVAVEGLALLILFGAPARKIPVRAWLNATLIHYTTMVVLPVGRAGAEVARAALLSPWVGKSRAAAGAALMQSITLQANALVSFICLSAVLLVVGAGSLASLLLINAVATLALGLGLYLVMRRAKIGGFLGKKFEAMAHFGPELDVHFKESRQRHPAAVAMALTGRSLQTLQYGVILLSVTSAFSAGGTLVAQGIHLVGAGLGDMIPNQVGITEGAYRIFAGALGLAKHPEKAVAIALIARVSTLGVAGLCAIGAWLLPRAEQPGNQASVPPSSPDGLSADASVQVEPAQP